MAAAAAVSKRSSSSEATKVGSLHVEPAWHGQGIGSRVMDWVEAVIASRFPMARLDVLSFNRQAITFYERRGWRERSQFSSTECGSEVEATQMVKDLPR